MIKFITKNNETFYDMTSMRQILKVQKSKIQRELKNIDYSDSEIIKYKNLYLFPERTLFYLMEIILIEKLEKQNDRF
jgi:hypothetical protein